MKYGLIVAAVAALAATSASADVLYYGGDIDLSGPNADVLANESDALVSDSAIYDNFTVAGGVWHVTGLFTNNFTNLGVSSVDWEIRSGVSEGDGGTLLFSGTAIPVITPTGRSGILGLSEYTIDAPVSFNLGPPGAIPFQDRDMRSKIIIR